MQFKLQYANTTSGTNQLNQSKPTQKTKQTNKPATIKRDATSGTQDQAIENSNRPRQICSL